MLYTNCSKLPTRNKMIVNIVKAKVKLQKSYETCIFNPNQTGISKLLIKMGEICLIWAVALFPANPKVKTRKLTKHSRCKNYRKRNNNRNISFLNNIKYPNNFVIELPFCLKIWII
jgi:hypothetical protein